MIFFRSHLILGICVSFTTAVFVGNTNRNNLPTKIANKNIITDVLKYGGWEKIFENENTIRESVIPLHQHGNKLYWMGTYRRLKWEGALQFCESLHMKLVTIHSAEENDRIHKYIREASKGTEYWIGGTRLVDGQSWVWMPYGTRIDYTNWSHGQPDNVNEQCLQLWITDNKLTWNDRDCNAEFLFICERYLGPVSGTHGHL